MRGYNVHGEANADRGIEVPTGCRSTSDDSKSDTNRETPANLEQTSERGHANRVF